MSELSGTLEGVGLPAIVRFLTSLKKTGCLRIKHEDWRGEIFFDAGTITSAALGTRRGLSALDALVEALPGGSFMLESETAAPGDRDIALSSEELLAHLEELEKRGANGASRLPSLDATPQVVEQNDAQAAEETVPLDRGTLQTLLAIDGRRTVRELVSHRGSFDALWQIGNLAELGLVRLTTGSGSSAAPVASTAPVAAAPVPSPAFPVAAAPAASPAFPVAAAPAPPRAFPPAPAAAPAPTPAFSVAPAPAPAPPPPPEVITPVAAPVVEPQPARPFFAQAPVPQPITPMSAEVQSTDSHCPKLGFEDDPSNSFSRATRLHRCFAAGAPLPLSMDQQRELCLTDQFGTCPRLTLATGATATPGEAEAVSRPPAFRRGMGRPVATGPSRAESDSDEPRIVRLPFAARGRASLVDRPAVGAPEPARFRGAVSPVRDTPTPTPLRAAAERPSAVITPPAPVVEEPVAPPVADVVPPVQPVPDTVVDGGLARRFVGVPVPLLAAGGVIVMAIAAIAFLLGPSLLVEDNLDTSALPNTSAVAAGTPVAQIASARSTAVARPAAAAPATQAEPVPDPTQPPVVPTLPPDPAPTVVAAASNVLLDERFADNTRNWPSSAQGMGLLTGGSYRLAPNQAGQFVAINAPIAQILQDVVVSATFRKLGGPAGGGYGIIVRDQATTPQNGTQQTGRYYVLEAGDKGEVGIWRRDGDHWVDLLPWQRSDAVRLGSAANELTVRAIGNNLTLAVNGSEIATRTDSALAAGGVGVFVGGDGNNVAVDRFTVQTAP